MKTANIRLSTIADVREFVNDIAAFEGEVDLSSGRYVVDGKSIMGIFSLDLLSPIKMTVQADDKAADELLEKIKKYIVE